jgi:hypothetical protein
MYNGFVDVGDVGAIGRAERRLLMQVFKRIVFCLGFALGLATAGLVGAVALTYLFTGKVTMVEIGDGNLKAQLLPPEAVVASVRRQLEKARAAHTAEAGGGAEDA